MTISLPSSAERLHFIRIEQGPANSVRFALFCDPTIPTLAIPVEGLSEKEMSEPAVAVILP
jgi:hypothetical protein